MAYMLFRGIEGCWARICCIPGSKMAHKALKNECFKMAATAVHKLVNVHIFFTKQGRNMNKVCFFIFSNMRNPMTNSDLW